MLGRVKMPSRRSSGPHPHTSSSWPGRSIARFPFRAFHTFSVQSLLPVTSNRLSADQAHW
jgi:hypothetical protein